MGGNKKKKATLSKVKSRAQKNSHEGNQLGGRGGSGPLQGVGVLIAPLASHRGTTRPLIRLFHITAKTGKGEGEAGGSKHRPRNSGGWLDTIASRETGGKSIVQKRLDDHHPGGANAPQTSKRHQSRKKESGKRDGRGEHMGPPALWGESGWSPWSLPGGGQRTIPLMPRRAPEAFKERTAKDKR